MGVSNRWMRKLLRRIECEGDRVAAHGSGARTSIRKIATQTRVRMLELLR